MADKKSKTKPKTKTEIDEFYKDEFIGSKTVYATITILIIFSLLMIYLLIQFWPSDSMHDNNQTESEITETETTSQQDGQEPEKTETVTAPSQNGQVEEALGQESVSIFGENITVSREARLLVLVLLASAFGGSITTLRYFTLDIGNKYLYHRWFGWYIATPIISSGLGLGFYLVIRGGFFSPLADVEQTSPFGFVALAMLVGFFSDQATTKLNEIANAVFTKSKNIQEGKDEEGNMQVDENDPESESEQSTP